jgi:ABC-type protease/lipase transport system fused ATPase/permease subunit
MVKLVMLQLLRELYHLQVYNRLLVSLKSKTLNAFSVIAGIIYTTGYSRP